MEAVDPNLKPLHDQSNVIEMRKASFGWEIPKIVESFGKHDVSQLVPQIGVYMNILY